MSASAGGAAVFDGKLSCVHDNDKEIQNDTQVLYIKETGKTVDAMILEMAKNLYESNAFDNFPNKSPEQFAIDAINRALAFKKIAKQKGLIK